MSDAIDLSQYTLSSGRHDDFAAGYCAMELAAHLAGEPHSDHPECVCPVIAAYVRTWQDNLPADMRQELVLPLVPRMLNTRATAEVQDRRAVLVADWAQRTVLPLWCDLVASLHPHAAALRALPEATTVDQLHDPSRVAIVAAAKSASAAAGAAAGDAAWAAAGDAAWAAARDACF